MDSIKQHKSSIYFELGGRGMLYSLNYEIKIYQKLKWNLSFQSGIGGYLANLGDHIIVPLSGNILFGNKHCLEIGNGANLVYDFSPYPRTKEKREEYRNNPELQKLSIYDPPLMVLYVVS